MSLLEKNKNITDSLQKCSIAPIPTGAKQILSETSLYAFFQRITSGELVVETILILPVFLIAVLTLISYMGIYSLQTEKLTETCQSAKELGIYSSVTENLPETMTVPNIYRFSFIFSLVPLKALYMENCVTIRRWVGETAEETSEEEERMVYVTENSVVFHGKNCSYLQPAVRVELYSSLNQLRNRRGEKYNACRKCTNQENGGVIYVTEDGNSYHYSGSCTSLSHVIIMMKYSEAIKDKRPCSRCGGGSE